MIPYEQLVAALTSWRHRQGLPVVSAEVFGAPVGLPIGDPSHRDDGVEEMGDESILADDDAETSFDDAGSTAIAQRASGPDGSATGDDDAMAGGASYDRGMQPSDDRGKRR